MAQGPPAGDVLPPRCRWRTLRLLTAAALLAALFADSPGSSAKGGCLPPQSLWGASSEGGHGSNSSSGCAQERHSPPAPAWAPAGPRAHGGLAGDAGTWGLGGPREGVMDICRPAVLCYAFYQHGGGGHLSAGPLTLTSSWCLADAEGPLDSLVVLPPPLGGASAPGATMAMP